MADDSTTGTFQVSLPQDLLTEAERANQAKKEPLQVEGWRHSWLSRIGEKLVGEG